MSVRVRTRAQGRIYWKAARGQKKMQEDQETRARVRAQSGFPGVNEMKEKLCLENSVMAGCEAVGC